MAYITEMDRIRAILNDPANHPMSIEQIIEEEIKEHLLSEQYRRISQAERYYQNRTDIQNKTTDIPFRSNTRLEHPILRKLVDQKANYLLSRPWSVVTDNREYGGVLDELFDPAFRRKIYTLGKDAPKLGVAYIQPYIDREGRLAFMRLPSREVIPIWRDEERCCLEAFIRFYNRTVYVGNAKMQERHAELWHGRGVSRFVCEPGESRGYRLASAQPHFLLNGAGYNFRKPPLAWLRYNDEELPLLHFVKELIDDVNWQSSVTADTLRDIAKFIYILRDYGGQDLAEFLRDLREHMAIKVEGGGGVEKLQADLDIEAVMAFLEKHRRDIYDYASGVDTQCKDLGNASGSAIHFRYMDLDADASALGIGLKDTFQQLKPFIDTYLQITGRGEFSAERFDVIFNMDMPVNEADVIANAKSLMGILSRRTVLENIPWVTSVDEELNRIKEEN